VPKAHRNTCPSWYRPGASCDCPEVKQSYSHCQDCGRRCEGNSQNQGYSECCNERIVSDPMHGDCYHKGGRWYQVD
jgi:hypothetical protein